MAGRPSAVCEQPKVQQSSTTHKTIRHLIFKMQKLWTKTSEVIWVTTFWLNWTLLRRPSASTWSKWWLRKQPIEHTTDKHSEVRNRLAPLFQAGSHIKPETNKLSDANKSFTKSKTAGDFYPRCKEVFCGSRRSRSLEGLCGSRRFGWVG